MSTPCTARGRDFFVFREIHMHHASQIQFGRLETCAKMDGGHDKWDLLSALTKAAEEFELTHRTLSVLKALMTFLPDRMIPEAPGTAGPPRRPSFQRRCCCQGPPRPSDAATRPGGPATPKTRRNRGPLPRPSGRHPQTAAPKAGCQRAATGHRRLGSRMRCSSACGKPA